MTYEQLRVIGKHSNPANIAGMFAVADKRMFGGLLSETSIAGTATWHRYHESLLLSITRRTRQVCVICLHTTTSSSKTQLLELDSASLQACSHLLSCAGDQQAWQDNDCRLFGRHALCRDDYKRDSQAGSSHHPATQESPDNIRDWRLHCAKGMTFNLCLAPAVACHTKIKYGQLMK